MKTGTWNPRSYYVDYLGGIYVTNRVDDPLKDSTSREKPESGHPDLFRGTIETPVH